MILDSMGSVTNEETRNEAIGRTVAAWRGDMSQKELAEKMREKGHKWVQSTVWGVESGTRPLRLTEAEDLVSILSGDLFGLVKLVDPWGAYRFTSLDKAQEALSAAMTAWKDYQLARAEAAEEVGTALASGDIDRYGLSPTLAAKIEHVLSDDGSPGSILKFPTEILLDEITTEHEAQQVWQGEWREGYPPDELRKAADRLLDDRERMITETYAAWREFMEKQPFDVAVADDDDVIIEGDDGVDPETP